MSISNQILDLSIYNFYWSDSTGTRIESDTEQWTFYGTASNLGLDVVCDYTGL
jgi:hypothetical protein